MVEVEVGRGGEGGGLMSSHLLVIQPASVYVCVFYSLDSAQGDMWVCGAGNLDLLPTDSICC